MHIILYFVLLISGGRENRKLILNLYCGNINTTINRESKLLSIMYMSKLTYVTRRKLEQEIICGSRSIHPQIWMEQTQIMNICSSKIKGITINIQ